MDLCQLYVPFPRWLSNKPKFRTEDGAHMCKVVYKNGQKEKLITNTYY